VTDDKPLDIDSELADARAMLEAYHRGEPEPAWDDAGDTLEVLIRALEELRIARGFIAAFEEGS